ncbi:hypothetical protein [Micromonospora sp. NPDC004551]|uniref:hypothetical protein n=1 Tax=Micromonospora sp. NPDC004551 TaxID=3154284 RepID=UPI0033BC8E51
MLSYFTRIAHRDGMWRTTVAPFLSALALGAILVVTIEQFDALLGVDPTSPLRWMLPASYVVAAAIGLA